ncbi:hypothetical protein [Telmatospirillum sp. J64-1]|uniref:hypothetical protein n=1 Tax=Telmatospirillum sp. J64-1 TaxID=2502183 RepID=UPI00115D2295|nr:hypothetical protein [Telmatospirillum sp. J64-1]
MARKNIDVEDFLHWALAKQKAGGSGNLDKLERRASGMQVYESSCDGVVALERIGILGTRIDGGAGGYDVHPDAALASQVVDALPGAVRGLVRQHALAGTRPDCMINARTRAVPLEGWMEFYSGWCAPASRSWGFVDGQRIGVPTWDRTVSKKWPVRTDIVWIDTPEEIQAARRVYLVWINTLFELAKWFQHNDSVLKSHSVQSPRASLAPWVKTGS